MDPTNESDEPIADRYARMLAARQYGVPESHVFLVRQTAVPTAPTAPTAPIVVPDYRDRPAKRPKRSERGTSKFPPGTQYARRSAGPPRDPIKRECNKDRLL
jgi:hypothetical protein